jgi:hypothetical protein
MNFSDQAALAVGRPIAKAFAILPSDDTDLQATTRALYVGTGGDLRVTMADGDIVSFTGLLTGVVYPFRLRKVFASGQPGVIAQALVGLY